MKRYGRTARIVALIIVALAIGLMRSAGAMAQDGTASITIHKAECPTGVGSAIFEDCHGNGLGGVAFAIGATGNEIGYVTDANGVIGPVDIPADTSYVVAEDPDVLATYLGAYVYCRDLTTDTVIFDGDLNGDIGVTGNGLPAGSEVVCDWYDITPATAVTSTTTTTTTTLPATGTGTMGGSDSIELALLALAGGLLLAGMTLRKRDT